MTTVVAATIIGSFLLSLLLTYLARAGARRIGFIDRPGGHKEHARAVALGGGVAIFLAIVVPVLGGTLIARALLLSGHSDLVPAIIQPHLPGIASRLPLLAAIMVGAMILHIVGLIDDIRPLGPIPKFAVEIVVAGILAAFFDVRAAEALGGVPSVLLTVFWMVLIINAFNFLDNIDGLSAGVAAIAASIFASSAMGAGQIFVPVIAWVLVGATLGFLWFNFAPASIFMGDAGSMVIGYFMAILTILTTYYDPGLELKPMGVLVPVVVLAVPLYDVASVVVHRIRARVSPFRGDRRHFSHRLVKRGMTTRSAVLTIYLATAATSISAIILPHASWRLGAVVFAQTLCIVLIIAILEHAPMRANPPENSGGRSESG